MNSFSAGSHRIGEPAIVVSRLAKALDQAQKEHDGHFSIMFFTTNVRAGFGTPSDRAEIEALPAGATLEQALGAAIPGWRWHLGRTCDLSLPDAKAILTEQENFARDLRVRPGETKPRLGSTPAELLGSFGEAERQIPMPRVGRFGAFWHYDADQGFVCCDAGGYHYELHFTEYDLGEIAFHLAGKAWIHAEALGDLVLMLHEVFGFKNWKDTPRFPHPEPRPKA